MVSAICALDGVDIPFLMHDTRLRQIDIKMTNDLQRTKIL